MANGTLCSEDCNRRQSSHEPSAIRRLLVISLLSLLLLLLGSGSAATQAQPAVPHQLLPPIDEELCPGEVLPFELTIYLPRTPAKGDIVFAFDTTGSMAPVIRSAQENAIRIMDDLNRLISDVQFGVIDLEDYPLEPYGFPDHNEAYRLRQPLTSDRDAVRFAIDELSANAGGDQPEAYTRAIYEAHADQRIGWRDDARRLTLVFGDSFSHDDALNEGISNPPYRPPSNLRWRTGHEPSFLDPGRDGVPGTPDDLDFQTELAALADHDITLLSVVTPVWFPEPTQSDLVIYWNAWAVQTGGRAVPLWHAGDLPELIRDLVEETIVGVIKRLALDTEPEFFEPWVYSDPAEITDIPIPSDGEYSFLGRIEAPADVKAGTYRFRIIAVGDGIPYGEIPVTITVPEECFPEPEYPTWYYLPLIAAEHAEREPSEPVEPTPYPP